MSDAPNRETQAILAPVIEWIQLLEKLLRSHRIYASGHVNIAQFEARLFKATCHLLDTQEEFSLAIKPYEFLFTEEVVYHSEDKQENISFRLHQDGLRHLTFHYGLTAEELRTFVEILRTDFSSYEYCDDDCVTLLWKANFEYISYIVVETFIESGRETEDMEVTLDRMARRIMNDQNPSSLSPFFSQKSSATRRRLKRQDAEMITQLPEYTLDASNELASLSEDTQKTLSLEDDAMVQRMFLVLFRVLLGQEDEQEFQSVATVVQRLAESLLRLQRFELASRVFQKLEQLSSPLKNPSPVNAKLMSDLWNRLNHPEIMTGVVDSIQDKKWEELPGIERFLAALGEGSIPQIFTLFLNTQHQEVRQHLIPLLAKSGSSQADTFSLQLRKAKPELAMDLLRLLEAMGVKQNAPQIRRGFSHADPLVRAHTLELLSKAGGGLGQSVSHAALEDSEKHVRLRALKVIVESKDLKALKKVFSISQSSDFENRDGDEKRYFFLGLARLAGTRVFDFFSDKLGNVLSRTEKSQETAIAAVWALHALATPDAKQVIEKERDRALVPQSVREACVAALKRWVERS